MSAELSKSEANAHGVRRLLCDEIDAAIRLLRGSRITDSEIHSARRTLKKARATLRLLRPAVAARVFKRENAALRDVARPLGAARDAKVLLDSLDRLAKRYGGPAMHSIPPTFRRQLTDEQAKSGGAVKRRYSERAAPIRSLRTSHERIVTARVQADGWKQIGEGIARVYRTGRKAMKQARKTPTPECLHEWRKQVKYLWHQLQLVEPMSPGPIGALADQMKKLSDYLGEDHDLAVLRAKVTAHAGKFPAPAGPGALLALIDRCQDRLRARAFFAGRRVYDDAPAVFTRRFERYWRRWNEPPAR
ncbi:MAG: CHAD domain-containing protein [Gammaproteobacteria bacterium]